MSTVAIIPTRGGSRGIANKNLLPVCGKPLVLWSIEQALEARHIDRVFVSSDSAEILDVAERAGAQTIRRPAELSGDSASSESAWLHALDVIATQDGEPDLVVGMQATSPVREAGDLDAAITQFRRDRLDSLVTCTELHHPLLWQLDADGRAASANHDYSQRKRRQQSKPQYLENGSFYLFTPELLRKTDCRLGGRIGVFVMPLYKLFQIDEPGDVKLCEIILNGYGLASRT